MLNQLHGRLKIMPNLEELHGTEDDIEKLVALVAPSPSLKECFGSNVVHEGARNVVDEASGERSMGDAHGQGNATPARGQSSTTHPYDRSMCLTGSSYCRMIYSGDEEQLVSRHLIQARSNTIVSYTLPINSSDTHKLWLASHISHTLSSEEMLLIEGYRRVRTRWTHIGRPNKQIPNVWLDLLASREVATVPDLSIECTPPIVASNCYFMETVVMDPTGTINANIAPKVLINMNDSKNLSMGDVLIVRNVLWFCPPFWNGYLNIAENNVVKIVKKDCDPETVGTVDITSLDCNKRARDAELASRYSY